MNEMIRRYLSEYDLHAQTLKITYAVVDVVRKHYNTEDLLPLEDALIEMFIPIADQLTDRDALLDSLVRIQEIIAEYRDDDPRLKAINDLARAAIAKAEKDG